MDMNKNYEELCNIRSIDASEFGQNKESVISKRPSLNTSSNDEFNKHNLNIEHNINIARYNYIPKIEKAIGSD